MKSKRPTRCGLAIAVFVGVLAVFSASTETADPVERITAVTVAGKTTPAETVEIVLLRWSTDAERSQFLPILSGKPTKEGDALDKVLLGYVWGSGGIGYVVRYAERQDDRITLVVNRNLGSWQGKPNWTPAPSLTYGQLLMRIGNEAYEGIKWEYERGVSPEILAKTYGVTAFEVEQVIRTASPEPEAKPIDLTRFSVVELRLAGATPQGKVVSATKIAADVSQGITVSDPGADSVQLRGIKRANASSPAAAPAAAGLKTPDAAPKTPAK
jgi:hypothetical protein